MDEAEEEKVESEKEKEEVKKKNSGNILVVETDFERMPRRSSFRSKERRELTRYSKCIEHLSQFTNQLIIYICLFFRGASIQFDEKPANVIVNSTDASESDGKDDDGDEEGGEGGADATSEE